MSEWDQRQLCSDGACVGVLGSDGTCTTCGKRGGPADALRPVTASEQAESSAGAASETDFSEDDEYYYEDDDDDDDGDDDDDDDEGDAEPDEDGAVSTAWSGRNLCPDGGCVGVMGETGGCKVCGKRAE